MPLVRGGNVVGRGSIRVGTRKRVAKQFEDFVDASFSESEPPILHPIPERPAALSRRNRGNRGSVRGGRGSRGSAKSNSTIFSSNLSSASSGPSNKENYSDQSHDGASLTETILNDALQGKNVDENELDNSNDFQISESEASLNEEEEDDVERPELDAVVLEVENIDRGDYGYDDDDIQDCDLLAVQEEVMNEELTDNEDVATNCSPPSKARRTSNQTLETTGDIPRRINPQPAQGTPRLVNLQPAPGTPRPVNSQSAPGRTPRPVNSKSASSSTPRPVNSQSAPSSTPRSVTAKPSGPRSVDLHRKEKVAPQPDNSQIKAGGTPRAINSHALSRSTLVHGSLCGTPNLQVTQTQVAATEGHTSAFKPPISMEQEVWSDGRFQRYMRYSMEYVKAAVRNLVEKVDGFEVDRKMNGPCLCDVKDVEAVESLFSLPLTSVEDVNTQETLLSLPGMGNKLKLVLLRRGGKTVGSAVNRIMEKLFSIQVGASYTWSGKSKKGESKFVFRDLPNINSAIFGALRSNDRLSELDTLDDDIEHYIKEWLRHCQERVDRLTQLAYQ